MGQSMSVNRRESKGLPASAGAGNFLSGGGNMGEMMRRFDWEHTILGSPLSWELPLKTCVRIMLTSPQPMFIWWDKEALINLYNDAYAVFLNSKHPEALGRSGKIVWSEVWEELQPKVDKVFANEGTYDDGAMFIMHRKGYAEETYIKFSYSPIAGEDGVIKGLFCVCEDESDKVISTRQLATLKEMGAVHYESRMTDTLYQEIINSIGTNNKDFPFAGIYEIRQSDTSVRLKAAVGINAGAQVLPPDFNIAGSDIVWPHMLTAIRENRIVVSPLMPDLPDLPTGFWKIPPRQLAFIPIGIGGNDYPYAIIVAALNPYRLYDDVYNQFCVSIAERLSLELNKMHILDQETKRAEALEEIDRAKTVFFSNISHEFRTPLTLMLGSLEALLEKGNTLTIQQQGNIDASHRNALRMLKLVNTLLDFSRIESGKMQANFTKVDIGILTQKLASNFTTLMETAGLQYHIHINNIGQAVSVDISMWEKILFNLLSNAFKYTWKGGVTVVLSVQGTNLVLEVADTGVGIPAADLPRIFDRFHRVQGSTGRSYEGSGIGLSLTRELVLFHKGEITVESKEGIGSVFRVTIPVDKEHLSQSQVNTVLAFPDTITDMYVEEATDMLRSMLLTDRVLPSAGRPDTTRDTILIVDDNADMRQYLKVLLESDYNVISAANGLEALIKIRRKQPALVLTDVMMPIMDGAQLLNEIRSSPATASLPVIILSARAGEECRMEGYDMGADDYLIKPFSAKELRSRVAGQIKTHKIRAAAQSQLHNIFKVAPAAIAVIEGPEFRFILGNAAYQKMVNRTEVELIGHTVEEVFPEVGGQGVLEILRQVYESELPLAMNEFPLRLNLPEEGKRQMHYFNFAVEPLRKPTGEMYALLVLAVDVTKQVLANKKILESEKKFSQLANAVPQLVWIADKEKQPVYFNDRINEFAGWEKREDGSYDITALIHPDDLPFTMHEWAAAAVDKTIFESEHRVLLKNGAYRWCLTRAYPQLSEAGDIVSWYGTTTNIHGQKSFAAELEKKVNERTEALRLANEELESKNIELYRQNQELASFNYIASHDLQEPLRKIQTFASRIIDMEETRLSDRGKDFLYRLNSAAARMQQLIADLLSFTRLRGNADNQFEVTSLGAIIEVVKSDLSEVITEKKASIILKKDCSPRVIPVKFRQLMQNLFSNALKFSHPDVPPVIEVNCETMDNRDKLLPAFPLHTPVCHIAVQDNGVGFEQKFSARIFEVFQRLHDKAAYQGTGIGLAIVKKIVENHDGVVTATSELGKGARFDIYIPVRE